MRPGEEGERMQPGLGGEPNVICIRVGTLTQDGMSQKGRGKEERGKKGAREMGGF